MQAGDIGGDRGDGGPDPIGDLVGREPVGTGQDGGELVAAVAVEPIRVAGRRGHGPCDAHEQRVSGGMAARVVERLERIEIHHQDRERFGRLLVVARLAERLAELALEGAVVA